MRLSATRLSATGGNKGQLPFNKFISALLSKSGRVAAYYGESWDEILAYNAVQVAAGTPANCVAFEDSAGTIPLVAPLGSGKGCGLLKDRSGGNHHRIQTSATARGEMSRRVNLCTGDSERVSSAAPWNLYDSYVIAHNQIAPPAGYSNCSRITATAIASAAAGSLGNAPYTGATLNMRIAVHCGNRTRINLLLRNNTTATALKAATLNSDGTWYGANLGYVSTPLGAGWFLIELEHTGGVSVNDSIGFYYGSTSAIPAGEFWHVTGLQWQWGEKTRYQRVTSASNYDEEGFPAFLRRQTDDWSKAHINPNGATKVFALTAIQKMSDAAIGAVLELGTNPASGSGNFSVLAPATVGPTYRMGSKGSTALVSTISDSTFPAPVRSLVVGIGDIANDVCSLTVNGTTTTSAIDQGTGTYTEQDVFFGARAGTSMFVNDREYSPPLILFMQPGDPGLTSAEISRLTAQFKKSIAGY